MITRPIPLDRIDVGTNRRALSRPAVKGLAASMAEVGLLSPITVHPIGDAYELVAGRHRVEAARSLGWVEIDAVLVDLGDIDRKLAEIDENLIRNELNDMERSEHLAERKRLYLLKHPETKHGAQGGGRAGVGTKRRTEDETVSFSVDTAQKTGRTERAIQQDVQIAESIPEDVRDAIRETPLADSKKDLLAIARLPEADQRAVVAEVDLTDKHAVRQAVAARRPAPEPEPEIHTTEVQTTVEAFALAALSIFDPNECRRLIALIREGLS